MARLPGDGAARRRRGGGSAARAAAAPLLRRVDRVAHAARLHAPRARLPRRAERGRAREDQPGARRDGAAAEEDRQRGDARRRRPRGAPDQRPRRRLVQGPDPRAARRARTRPRMGARGLAGDGADRRRARLPRARAGLRARGARRRRRVPDRPRRRGRHLDAATPSRSRRSSSTSSRSTSSTRTRCTHGSTASSYLVGPMARYALHRDKLSPQAREAAAEVGLEPVVRNPFRSIVVRAVELVHACEEALRLIAAYEQPAEPALEVDAEGGNRPRRERGAARDPLPPLPARRGRRDPRREDRPADLAEPALDRERSARVRLGAHGPARRRAAAPLRAGDPQLRPVHLLRDALPDARGRAVVRTVVVGVGNELRGDDAVGLHVARGAHRTSMPPSSSARASRSGSSTRGTATTGRSS